MIAPFSGLWVLDMSRGFAGSFCSRLMADQGASVFKMSLKGRKDISFDYGSPLGIYPDKPDTPIYHYLNLNKMPVNIEGSKDRFYDFLSNVDVLVEDLSSHERGESIVTSFLSHIPPNALTCAINPFYRDSKWSNRPSSDLTAQAMAGYCSVNGTPGETPLKEPGTETEFMSGANAFLGLVSALVHRDKTGNGQSLEVSTQHSALSSYGPYLLGALQTQEPRRQQQQGLHFGLLPCKDGYVSISVRHELTWEHLWVYFGDPDFAKDPRFDTAAKRRENEHQLLEILLPLLACYTRQELLTGLSPFRILVGPANSIRDLIEDDHLKARNSFFRYGNSSQLTMPSNPIRMTKTPWKFRNLAPEPLAVKLPDLGLKKNKVKPPFPVRGYGPLHGMRAIVLTQAWAGAYCTQLLGDLGMEILQVESVNRLDPWRGGIPPKLSGLYPDKIPGDSPWNRNALYNSVNRNKKGITLDLNDADCKSALLDMVSCSDLFVENFSGRVIGNLELNYEILRKVNPSLIMLRMPTYGTYGPYSNFPGNGGTTEPVSGMSYLMGYEGGPPMNSGIMHTDAYSGILAAGAAVTALRHRLRTGEGQLVELSQQESTVSLLAEYIMESSLSGELLERQGNSQRNAAPQGCYLSADKAWIALTVFNQENWITFCGAISSPDLIEDVRFKDIESRTKNRKALDNIISTIIGKRHSGEFSRKLRTLGIPCEIVQNTYEAAQSKDFKEMGMFEKVRHPDTGPFDHVSPPWIFSATPARLESPAPTLGQHTEEVLLSIVGWTSDKVAELLASEHSGDSPIL